MDLYLASSEPGLTLQEMIDCDIKCGIEFEDGFGGFNVDQLMHTHDIDTLDVSSMSNLDNDLDLKYFEPIFDPLDKFEDEEPVEVVEPSPNLNKRDVVASWMNFSSMNSYNMDMEPGTMVNPSAVLPSTLHGGFRNFTHGLSASAPNSSPSPVHEQVTRSCSDDGSSVIASASRPSINGGSCDAADAFQPSIFTTKESVITSTHQSVVTSGDAGGQSLPPETINTRVVLGPISASSNATPLPSISLPMKNSTHGMTYVSNAVSRDSSSSLISIAPSQSTIMKHLNSSPAVTSIQQHSASLTPITSVTSVNRNTTPNYHQNRTISNANLFNRGGKPPTPKYKLERTPEERTFPKPAYSYSCLIALALKNSITGSLPVSEIYSFMCEHFPYFRTAPNGWKNSVRHNLSLNKCFEKIEKPIVSGSNQRKGCLWALNPAKGHKMDEEVQKWSKKDLQGIKDAMTNPEILENLERGEMKFEATSSGASSCSEDEEEEEKEDMEVLVLPSATDAQTNTELQTPIKILNPLTPSALLASNSQQKNATRLIQANGLRTFNHVATKTVNGQAQKQSNSSTMLVSQRANHAVDSQQLFRRVSQDTEYSLPDSTMQEISIQSNGAIIDDFGNEISLEGELGILNPSSGSSSGNLILRKVTSSSPLRHSTIRSNFVYSASPHQNGLNRLVLANTKMS